MPTGCYESRNTKPKRANLKSEQDRARIWWDQQPGSLEFPKVKLFRAPMDDLSVVLNRRKLLLRDQQGKRCIIRLQMNAYGQWKGRTGYQHLNRMGVVFTCVSARQAEAVLVSVMRMCMKIDGLELNNPDLIMEHL